MLLYCFCVGFAVKYSCSFHPGVYFLINRCSETMHS